MDSNLARARLLQEQRELIAMEQGLDASFQDIVDAARDSNLDDEHDPEGSTIAAERSLVSSLGRSATDRLAQIDAALARLEAGTYGVCLSCGGIISDGRLEARPAAPLCITCASR
jgi:DnaK suppressor protein